MRLTCPNCGAEYDVPEGMVPPAGRHVQCTSCHTRWFVRGGSRPTLSEDQIIRRLEAWSPRPRPVPVPDPAPEPVADEAAGFVWEEDPPEDAEAPPADTAETPPSAAPPVPPAPVVPQPRPVSAPLPEAAAQRPRLDLSPAPAAEPPLRGPSRFGRGLVAALVLFLLALAAYMLADPIAARVPALAPALQGFAATVDGLRESLAERLGSGTEG